MFVLGCLTGFRFSDYSDIKPEEVRDGILYVNQTKTLSTVVVPLRNDAKKILIEKYKMQMPLVSNPNFNYYIKEVVRLAGINEMIKITHKRGNKIIEETKPKYNWIMGRLHQLQKAHMIKKLWDNRRDCRKINLPANKDFKCKKCSLYLQIMIRI